MLIIVNGDLYKFRADRRGLNSSNQSIKNQITATNEANCLFEHLTNIMKGNEYV